MKVLIQEMKKKHNAELQQWQTVLSTNLDEEAQIHTATESALVQQVVQLKADMSLMVSTHKADTMAAVVHLSHLSAGEILHRVLKRIGIRALSRIVDVWRRKTVLGHEEKLRQDFETKEAEIELEIQSIAEISKASRGNVDEVASELTAEVNGNIKDLTLNMEEERHRHVAEELALGANYSLEAEDAREMQASLTKELEETKKKMASLVSKHQKDSIAATADMQALLLKYEEQKKTFKIQMSEKEVLSNSQFIVELSKKEAYFETRLSGKDAEISKILDDDARAKREHAVLISDHKILFSNYEGKEEAMVAELQRKQADIEYLRNDVQERSNRLSQLTVQAEAKQAILRGEMTDIARTHREETTSLMEAQDPNPNPNPNP